MRWFASVAVAVVQHALVADHHVDLHLHLLRVLQGDNLADDLEDADLVEHAHDLHHLEALRAGLQGAERVAFRDHSEISARAPTPRMANGLHLPTSP